MAESDSALSSGGGRRAGQADANRACFLGCSSSEPPAGSPVPALGGLSSGHHSAEPVFRPGVEPGFRRGFQSALLSKGRRQERPHMSLARARSGQERRKGPARACLSKSAERATAAQRARPRRSSQQEQRFRWPHLSMPSSLRHVSSEDTKKSSASAVLRALNGGRPAARQSARQRLAGRE
jgi:hypothetical protein